MRKNLNIAVTFLLATETKKRSVQMDEPLFGAAGQIRTADLVITNDALYRLSYSSMAVSNSFIIIA